MLQRNPNPAPVTLPETRDASGAVHPTVTVEGGAQIDWPWPVAGFQTLETHAVETVADQPAETAKPKSSASAKAAAKADEGTGA